MRNLIAKELKIKFIETLNELDGFSYEEGNPFLIKINTKQYFIFLKNLSPAYFKNSPDITRVQLPYSEHFSKIFNANIPFIIFGYDVDNDTLASWNPNKIKERLNAKSNVSLYSRYSLQEKVENNEFKFGYLSNGEKIILFKREFLINFFYSIDELFNEKQNLLVKCKKNEVNDTLEDDSIGKLTNLSDSTILDEIIPFLKKNQVLKAVEITSQYFKGKYNNMTFKDWYKLVIIIYNNIKQ